jgi:hypothetical protein
MELRKISAQENELLELLIKRASIPALGEVQRTMLVYPMDDGGMGSLRLVPTDPVKQGKRLAKKVSEYHFLDKDGVRVITSLYTDEDGDLFELDIWKVDFNPLISLPSFTNVSPMVNEHETATNSKP